MYDFSSNYYQFSAANCHEGVNEPVEGFDHCLRKGMVKYLNKYMKKYSSAQTHEWLKTPSSKSNDTNSWNQKC
jgi:hypothetical protein